MQLFFCKIFLNLYIALNVPPELILIQCAQRPFGGKPIRTLMMDGHKNQINQGMDGDDG